MDLPLFSAVCPSCGFEQRYQWSLSPRLYRCCSCGELAVGQVEVREKVGKILLVLELKASGMKAGVAA